MRLTTKGVEIGAVRGVLLDVEGTTSAVSYVYDVMFPYARNRLESYLAERWGSDALRPVLDQFAADLDHKNYDAWLASTKPADGRAMVLRQTIDWMEGDVKATSLKTLQGLIWESGFRNGELRAHVYPDVRPALEGWKTAGVDLRIYSSGSVLAQKMFFGHSEAGDLLPLISGHYDTTSGPKREPESYLRVATDWGLPPEGIVFLSDIVAELRAAQNAGLRGVLVVRPGNAPADPGHGFLEVHSLADLSLRG